jgi:hypothetical protein
VRRLKALEAENAGLKKLVAERDLEIEIMKEVAAKKLVSVPARRAAEDPRQASEPVEWYVPDMAIVQVTVQSGEETLTWFLPADDSLSRIDSDQTPFAAWTALASRTVSEEH